MQVSSLKSENIDRYVFNNFLKSTAALLTINILCFYFINLGPLHTYLIM